MCIYITNMNAVCRRRLGMVALETLFLLHLFSVSLTILQSVLSTMYIDRVLLTCANPLCWNIHSHLPQACGHEIIAWGWWGIYSAECLLGKAGWWLEVYSLSSVNQPEIGVFHKGLSTHSNEFICIEAHTGSHKSCWTILSLHGFRAGTTKRSFWVLDTIHTYKVWGDNGGSVFPPPDWCNLHLVKESLEHQFLYTCEFL